MADEIERQESRINAEEDFKEWLKTRDKQIGEGTLSPSSQGNYLGALRKSINIFREEYEAHSCTNIFDITDPTEFIELVRAIESNTTAFFNYNTHRNFSTGAETYLAFLNGEGNKVGEHDPKLPDGRARYGGEIYEGGFPDPPKPPKPPKSGGKGPVTPPPQPLSTKEPRNLIFFGAPGTGKSYLLNKRSRDLLGDDGESVRVTFHPDYSYAHFVGTYKPVPEGREITYKYVPGPFMETYVKAVENPNNRYLLIIEEINRANVAAVFGDVFQLLDRKNGVSEYPVKASRDLQNYLGKDLNWDKKGIEYKEIKIPENMYIWATMNSADQGVFPMDTAFKRRWEFKYLDINTGKKEIRGKMVPMGASGQQEWNEVRREINRLLRNLGINEDKQLGAFFVGKDIIDNAEADPKTFENTFMNKVLMYLFEDAAKHKRKELFGDGKISYSEVCRRFKKKELKDVFKGYGAGKSGGDEDNDEDDEDDETDTSAEVEGE